MIYSQIYSLVLEAFTYYERLFVLSVSLVFLLAARVSDEFSDFWLELVFLACLFFYFQFCLKQLYSILF